MVEQGTSFTIVHAPSPMNLEAPPDANPRRDFLEARRVWLGATNGTDWLVAAIEREFGEDMVAYEVESNRRAIHIGASGEFATVVLVLLGAGVLDVIRKYYGGFVERLGEVSADAFLEWVRDQSRAHREEVGGTGWDGPPDFFERDVESLGAGLRGELADLLGVPDDQVELVSARREPGVAIRATYRDKATAVEYVTELTTDALTVTRHPKLDIAAEVARGSELEAEDWESRPARRSLRFARDLVSRVRGARDRV